MENPDSLPLICHRCGAMLETGSGQFYVVRIEAFADPSPPDISKEPLELDVAAEMERLVEALRNVTAQEAMDQVYRKLTLYLCPPCYSRWIEDPTAS